MIERKSLLAFEFYKKSPFSGSDKGMRYRIEKIENDEDKQLRATIWPEPFSYENTDEDKKETHFDDFSEEGLCNIVDWLNENQPRFAPKE